MLWLLWKSRHDAALRRSICSAVGEQPLISTPRLLESLLGGALTWGNSSALGTMLPSYLWLRGPAGGHRGQPLSARRNRAARCSTCRLVRAPEVLRARLQGSRACELTPFHHHYHAPLAALLQQMDRPTHSRSGSSAASWEFHAEDSLCSLTRHRRRVSNACSHQAKPSQTCVDDILSRPLVLLSWPCSNPRCVSFLACRAAPALAGCKGNPMFTTTVSLLVSD